MNPMTPDERQALAKDLHDGLSQVVNGLLLSLFVHHETLKRRDAEETDEVAEMLRMAKSAGQHIQDLMTKIRTVPTDQSSSKSSLSSGNAKILKTTIS